MIDTKPILEIATQAAFRAGAILRARLGTDLQISKKGTIDLVTEADLEAERAIIDLIRSRFSDHEILAEEQGSQAGSADCKWIIDPLDGTTNFAHGYRFFCVSIAVEIGGAVTVGVVFDPVTEELFTTIKGEGASLNGSPIRVSTQEQLIDSLLCTGFSYQSEEIQSNLELFNRVIHQVRAVRRDGSAALDLCYVACGRFDGFWELSLNPWDVAAGTLMVQEAGGQLSGFDGSPCTIYDREILATNGRVHSALGGILAPGKPS